MSQSWCSGKSAASLNARLVKCSLEAAVFWGSKGLLFGPTLMTVYVQAAWEKQCSWELMSTPLLALTQRDRWKGKECLYWYPKFFQQAVPALARVADREDER